MEVSSWNPGSMDCEVGHRVLLTSRLFLTVTTSPVALDLKTWTMYTEAIFSWSTPRWLTSEKKRFAGELSLLINPLWFPDVYLSFDEIHQFIPVLNCPFLNNKWFFHPINNRINKPSINWCRISQPSTVFFSNLKAYEVHLRSDFLQIAQLPLSTPRLQGPATRRRRKTWNSASPDAEGRIPWVFWRKMGLQISRTTMF